MKLEINIEKKPVLFLTTVIIGIVLVGVVIAYTVNPGTVPNPGHALSTIQGAFQGDTDLQDSLEKLNIIYGGASCAAGSSIRVINADGTVVCETDDGGAATVDCGSITGGSDPDYCVDDGGTGNIIGGGSQRYSLSSSFICPGLGPNWGTGSCSGGQFICTSGTTRLTGRQYNAGAFDWQYYYYICVN